MVRTIFLYDEHRHPHHVADLLQYIFCKDIVCYGIGCFGTCFIARQQLAFLLLIASAMKVRNCQQSNQGELKARSLQAKSVMVYDPRLSVQERASLEELGCVNIQHNEVTKCSQSCAVFYTFITL